jgi:hypothetical protein
VVARVLLDITEQFPELTPEVVWYTRSRGQMMSYWRAAQRQKKRATAANAISMHAAARAAIWGDKERVFQTMIDKLMEGQGQDTGRAGIPNAATLSKMSPAVPGEKATFTQGASGLDGFTKF